MAYVKTFRLDEYDTIYCEREWRSLRDFGFGSWKNVLMVVLPERYIEGLCKALPSQRKDTTIVPWEVLMEH